VSVVANVAINVDSRNAVSKLRQVNDAGSKLEQTFKGVDGKLRDSSGRFIKLGDSAQASTGKINVLARALSNLGTGLAVADVARRYFKGFNEAEKAAAAVRTLGVDSKALEGNLLGLSQKLGGLYSQTQLLAASYDVASAGFANAADNAKILEASAKGATGGLSDINTVADAVTSVLNTYGKSAAEAGALVDGFIQTQNDGKIILNQYADQIGKLAPTAAAAGVGIQELNAAIATITPQGVRVEAAVAGLNQALVAILKPSKEASDLAEALGIDFNEAGLRAKGFGGLLEEVKTKTGGSTTQLVKLFGSVDAIKAILPLVNDDLVKYNQNVAKQANASGVAEKATQELGGTVSSEITKMINQIGNLTRALDTVLGPSLGGIVRLINFVIAEATKGIQVLGQLFSMSPNKMIAQQAVRSGQIGAAPRTLAGIDETIGEKRRKALQQQAGAGTGFLGLGMNTEKFIKLLQQQPEFKSPVTASNKPAAVVDPALQALLDKLAAGGGSGGGSGGRTAGGGSGGSKAENDAKRALEIQKRQYQAADDRNTALKDTFALLQQTEAVAKRELELDIRLGQIAREFNTLKEEAKSADELAMVSLNENLEKKIAELEAEREINELLIQRATLVANLVKASSMPTVYNELETQDAALQAILDKYPAIGSAADAAATLATSGMAAMIDGTKSAQEVFAEFLNTIANALMQTAAKMIAQYIAIGIARMFAGMGGGVGNFAPSGPLAAVGNVNTDVSSFFSLNADGNAFGANGIIPFAKGGIVNSPTLFPFAKGIGLMGEAGPEAILPLKRGADGSLGVMASGGGGNTNVVVNVDAKGSSVEGDEQGANQLGRVISAAVQSELIKQQRPGGILAR
jgi:TP901 family phage tail tape measure protein/lambda family phage tail tape measure protein